MAASQFFITLPSNTITDKENKASHYRVRIPNRLVLTGEWEVALCEIIYPHTWENVTKLDRTISVVLNDKKVQFVIVPNRYYSSIQDLVEAIQWAIRQSFSFDKEEMEGCVVFSYNIYSKKVSIKIDPKFVRKVILPLQFQHLLGFDEQVTVTGWSKHPYDLRAGFESMYVYCNLVESQIVGNIMAPLLRIVSIDDKSCEIINRIYDSPHYIPVQVKDISDIEISIRTDTNEPVNFVTGKVIVKLHFRKKSLL